MKRIYLLILLSFTLNSSFSQDLGDILVNKNFPATLVFSDSISLVLCGNNPKVGAKFKYYDIFKYKKMCVIRGNDSLAPEISLTVYLYNDKIWCGKLKYGLNTKIRYNFSDEEQIKPELSTTNKTKAVENVIPEVNQDSLRIAKLNEIMQKKPEYYSFGLRDNGMEFQVSNIYNDQNYTYFKIIVRNNTGSIYNVDGVYFKYVEGKAKGVKEGEANTEQRIFPVYESPVKEIAAYKTEELGFIIPLFTVGKSGNLSIQLREANGTRNPLILIKGSDMLKVKVLSK